MIKKKNKPNKLFDSKVFWAAVSLLASLLIWGYVTGTQEQPIEETYKGVEVQLSGQDALLESKGYVISAVDTTTVTVRISGTRSNIGKLEAKDIKAVIDLARVTSGTGNYKVSYKLTYPDTVNADAIDVVSLDPENIQFHVAKMSSKIVEVRGAFEGSVAEGFVAEEPVFEPETITVSGPDNELNNIGYVWAAIGGDDISKTKTAEVAYTIMDAEGNVLNYDGLDFDYETVKVTVPIKMKKEVPLDVTLVPGAGATSDNCVVTIEPKTITILGDASLVDGINKIVVATVDLTDFPDTLDETYPIVLDNDVENLTGVTEAKVNIEIKGLKTKKLSTTNLSFTNAPPGVTAEILNKNLEVTIRAPEDVLDQIKADNVRAVADLTDIATRGDVSVPVKILIAGFSDTGAIGDYKITINISG